MIGETSSVTRDPLAIERETFAYNAMYLQALPFLSDMHKLSNEM